MKAILIDLGALKGLANTEMKEAVERQAAANNEASAGVCGCPGCRSKAARGTEVKVVAEFNEDPDLTTINLLFTSKDDGQAIRLSVNEAANLLKSLGSVLQKTAEEGVMSAINNLLKGNK